LLIYTVTILNVIDECFTSINPCFSCIAAKVIGLINVCIVFER